MLSLFLWLVEVFCIGEGIVYFDYGEDMCDGIVAFNCMMFINEFGSVWLLVIVDVHVWFVFLLCVVDVGCGIGWLSIVIVHVYL